MTGFDRTSYRQGCFISLCHPVKYNANWDDAMSKSEQITAAVLVIGDEILSGRTKDTNSGYIAEYLTNIGVDLMEIRVVSDDMETCLLYTSPSPRDRG